MSASIRRAKVEASGSPAANLVFSALLVAVLLVQNHVAGHSEG
jgi:hypothetical protein